MKSNLPLKVLVNIIVKRELAGCVVAEFRDNENSNNEEHDDRYC